LDTFHGKGYFYQDATDEFRKNYFEFIALVFKCFDGEIETITGTGAGEYKLKNDSAILLKNTVTKHFVILKK